MVRRALRAASTTLAVVAGVLLVITMVLVVADIVRRNAGLGGIAGSIEYTELLLIGVFFLALGYTQRQDAHVAVDLVVERLPGRVAEYVIGSGLLLVVPLLLWLAWTSGLEALEAYRTNEFRMGLSHLPIWPFRAIVPVSTVFLVLEMVVSALDRLRGHDGVAALDTSPGGV